MKFDAIFSATLSSFKFHVRQYSFNFNYNNDDKSMFGTYSVLHRLYITLETGNEKGKVLVDSVINLFNLNRRQTE